MTKEDEYIGVRTKEGTLIKATIDTSDLNTVQEVAPFLCNYISKNTVEFKKSCAAMRKVRFSPRLRVG